MTSVHLLLLGPEGVGKSTLAQQLRHIYGLNSKDNNDMYEKKKKDKKDKSNRNGYYDDSDIDNQSIEYNSGIGNSYYFSSFLTANKDEKGHKDPNVLLYNNVAVNRNAAVVKARFGWNVRSGTNVQPTTGQELYSIPMSLGRVIHRDDGSNQNIGPENNDSKGKKSKEEKKKLKNKKKEEKLKLKREKKLLKEAEKQAKKERKAGDKKDNANFDPVSPCSPTETEQEIITSKKSQKPYSKSKRYFHDFPQLRAHRRERWGRGTTAAEKWCHSFLKRFDPCHHHYHFYYRRRWMKFMIADMLSSPHQRSANPADANASEADANIEDYYENLSTTSSSSLESSVSSVNAYNDDDEDSNAANDIIHNPTTHNPAVAAVSSDAAIGHSSRVAGGQSREGSKDDYYRIGSDSSSSSTLSSFDGGRTDHRVLLAKAKLEALARQVEYRGGLNSGSLLNEMNSVSGTEDAGPDKKVTQSGQGERFRGGGEAARLRRGMGSHISGGEDGASTSGHIDPSISVDPARITGTANCSNDNNHMNYRYYGGEDGAEERLQKMLEASVSLLTQTVPTREDNISKKAEDTIVTRKDAAKAAKQRMEKAEANNMELPPAGSADADTHCDAALLFPEDDAAFCSAVLEIKEIGGRMMSAWAATLPRYNFRPMNCPSYFLNDDYTREKVDGKTAGSEVTAPSPSSGRRPVISLSSPQGPSNILSGRVGLGQPPSLLVFMVDATNLAQLPAAALELAAIRSACGLDACSPQEGLCSGGRSCCLGACSCPCRFCRRCCRDGGWECDSDSSDSCSRYSEESNPADEYEDGPGAVARAARKRDELNRKKLRQQSNDNRIDLPGGSAAVSCRCPCNPANQVERGDDGGTRFGPSRWCVLINKIGLLDVMTPPRLYQDHSITLHPHKRAIKQALQQQSQRTALLSRLSIMGNTLPTAATIAAAPQAAATPLAVDGTQSRTASNELSSSQLDQRFFAEVGGNTGFGIIGDLPESAADSKEASMKGGPSGTKAAASNTFEQKLQDAADSVGAGQHQLQAETNYPSAKLQLEHYTAIADRVRRLLLLSSPSATHRGRGHCPSCPPPRPAPVPVFLIDTWQGTGIGDFLQWLESR